MVNMLVAFILYHFKRIDINQMPAILFASTLIMAYNLAKDSDKEKYAFSWSFLLCIGTFTLAAFMVTPYSLILGVISLVFIFLNFADSSEYKQEIKEVTGKETTKEVPQETQPIKTPEYNIKDVIKAKNKLQLIEIDSKKMTVEIVVPQNLGYFFATIDNLMNEKQDFDNFIQWVKFVNNNCYAAWEIVKDDNDRIDTLECLQRIMSITKPLLDKYGGDCFIETK
jgi:hypothetical protein